MASFENNLAKMESTLRRALTQDERRLLKLWDLTCQSSARGALAQETPAAAPPPVDETTYTGRFKIVATKGYFEIYFVCGKLMLRPVEADDHNSVLDFLVQDAINLPEHVIQQAIASATISRPVQIPHDVSLTEPLLRSMGFKHVNG
jgi:hypothetical protein